MDRYMGAVASFVLLLTLSRTSCTGATDIASNAQAPGTDAAAAIAQRSHPEAQLLVKRYVPQFVGKRELDMDKVAVDAELGAPGTATDIDDLKKMDESNLLYLLGRYDMDIGETPDIDDIDEDVNQERALNDDGELLSSDDDTDKRSYHPTFVGKRYRPMFVGKRYTPRFVGKKSRNPPMFVGKRYQPMFVGKRYQPMFVGKKYQPMFVGKRYQPMFVGKRYQPMFVGKRYQPMFVGKKATSPPMFVGKRPQYTPMFVGKRSATNFEDITQIDGENSETQSRQKRSILLDGTQVQERSWGHYMPLQGLSAVGMHQSPPQMTAHKRFVPPEFIGRRESMDSILSALKALRIARNQPRYASKRFQAPLFIGKRTAPRYLAEAYHADDEQNYGLHYPDRR